MLRFFRMRILGIDPGSQWMGLGCVEKRGSRLVAIGHRIIIVKPKQEPSWAERLRTVFSAVGQAIADWNPEVAAIESVFLHKNASSALKLGQARGAAIAAIAMRGLELHEYSPREVKRGVTTSGGADKQQVEKMVCLLLGASLKDLGELPTADAADALAVAICHSQRIVITGKGAARGPLRISAKELR